VTPEGGRVLRQRQLLWHQRRVVRDVALSGWNTLGKVFQALKLNFTETAALLITLRPYNVNLCDTQIADRLNCY